MFFPRKGAFPAGQNLVFKGFQFVSDVAFGAFQRLFARVLRRHEVRVRMRDLNEIAVNPVVAHFQAGNSGLLLLGFS